MANEYYNHLDEESLEDGLNIASDSWGGPWTEEKLETFEDYVKNVYLKIMNQNRDKYHWKLIYFDAFAGSGSRTKKGFVWPTGPYEARRCTLRLQYYGDFALF